MYSAVLAGVNRMTRGIPAPAARPFLTAATPHQACERDWLRTEPLTADHVRSDEICQAPPARPTRGSLYNSLSVKSLPFYRAARAALAATFVCCSNLPARAQVLPSEPFVLGDGRLTIGGDVSA